MRRQDDHPGRRRNRTLRVISTWLTLGVGFWAGIVAAVLFLT